MCYACGPVVPTRNIDLEIAQEMAKRQAKEDGQTQAVYIDNGAYLYMSSTEAKEKGIKELELITSH